MDIHIYGKSYICCYCNQCYPMIGSDSPYVCSLECWIKYLEEK